TVFGQARYNPASRFTDEVPEGLIDWRSLGSVRPSFVTSAPRREASTGGGSRPSFGSRPAIKTVSSVDVGERVLHTSFGLGTVIAVQGIGDAAKADVDFGSAGVKRLSLKHAPMEKL
ncbi:MAG TPA: ATP-dependent DNA helicase PcrA, partial [Propionibacteriaceae bacterium]|nr:ATP-dependent DNA helicase PcrA [Propionibacteriaceae bacterium]